MSTNLARRLAILGAAALLAVGLAAFPRHLASRAAVSSDFVHFESAQVHPVAMTPDGSRLLVVNTPDNRLSVFDLTGAEPVRLAEIPVGLEPVSVAALDDQTAWVVNTLSDDVSIVDLGTLHVKATLRVGDEPNDVVFAGSPRRAYVSVSQEDRIRAYDPANLSTPPLDIPIDGRYPRALATNADRSLVYAAVLFAGNRTSVLSFQEVPADSQPQDPEFPRDPQLSASHGPGPRVGLIVQQQGEDWRDMYGKLWNYRIPYTHGDVYVAEIPAGASSPSRTFDGLGAVNFAIAVSPADGRVAVASTEARNLLRFEPRIRGHAVYTQMGFITAGGSKTIVPLNPHVNYAGPGTQAERDSAIGIPTGLAYSGDGRRAYVTSLASDKLGVLDPETGAIVARVSTVAGPTGIVVDDARGRIYVVGRHHNQLQTLSTASLQELGRAVIGFDPTPDEIVNGRKFFYGGFTSAHGEQACASCHLFGDFDNLAWDLGDPGGAFHAAPPGMTDPLLEGFDPMKGPMTTQSLRGLPGTGRLHWRADRENLADFNQAFVGLLGRTSQLPDSEMTAFSEFVSALVHPPNPAQYLDRTLPDAPAGEASPRRGRDFFLNTTVVGDNTCVTCHAGTAGTNGQVVNDAALRQDQDLKVPQLRNLYRKTGFADRPLAVSKRGFGFSHDGAFGSLLDFLRLQVFDFGPEPYAEPSRRDVEAFLLAFDTGMAPAVGHRITFDAANRNQASLIARMDTLSARSAAGDCDLIAKGRVGGQPRGWWYRNDGTWLPDRQGAASLSSAALRGLAGTGSEITITGVPLGSGMRAGVDRDRDGHLDGDELAAGSDPGNPTSVPANLAPSVSAGPDQTITLPATAALEGVVTDDDLPSPPTLARVWRKASGPGQVVFADSLSARTPASFSRVGTYRLSLTATDGQWTASDEVTIVARAAASCQATLDRRTASGADDAEESASGSVSLTSSDLELVADGGVQTVGLRFTGINIPPGVVVTNAYILFTADEVQSEATALTIRAQDADSAAAFTTASRNVSARPRTDASVAWAPAAWTQTGVAGATQRTPDLSALVQEVIDQPGWLGKSLAFVIVGTGHRTADAFEGGVAVAPLLHIDIACDGSNLAPTANAGPDLVVTLLAGATLAGVVTDDGLPDPPAVTRAVWRQVAGPGAVLFADSLSPQTSATFSQGGTYDLSLIAFDGSRTASDGVQVVVQPPAGTSVTLERSVAAGSDDAEEKASGSMSLTSSDLELVHDGSIQTVGMRFTGITIPRGSSITAASIQFRAKESQSEATTLAIRGQDAGQAATFTTVKHNLSSRPRTGASVSWSPAAWISGGAGAAQQTPDLSAIVQAIVNRADWASGNALVIIVTGTGHRTANAFEATRAPLLHVEYAPATPGAPGVTSPGTASANQGPSVTRLGAVFPNPGSGPATIRFELARPAEVQIEVFDLRGALVRRVLSGHRTAGRHSEHWDGRDRAERRLAKGVYLVRFTADRYRETRKLVIRD